MQDIEQTNADIVSVYESIYGPHYRLSEQSLSYSYRTIASDLAWMGHSAEWLATARVFNVGTGREAYVFKQLGARQILHADLSAHAIMSLQQRAESEGWAARLASHLGDICAAPPFQPACVELCYLNGVLQHLNRPAAAIHNLASMLVHDGLFFFRIYRSGSFLFFLASCLRQLVAADERSYFLQHESSLMSGHGFLFTDMIDDLFVPVLNLIDCDALDQTFRSCGYEPVVKDAWIPYDHAPTCDPFYRGLYRKIERPAPTPHELVFVDQIRDIEYAAAPARTLRLLKTRHEALCALPLPARARLITDAYALHDLACSEAERHEALHSLIER